MHQEIQDVLGQNFGIPDDIDEDELMEELDALEDDLAADTEANADGVPSYLQVRACVMMHCLCLLPFQCQLVQRAVCLIYFAHGLFLPITGVLSKLALQASLYYAV